MSDSVDEIKNRLQDHKECGEGCLACLICVKEKICCDCKPANHGCWTWKREIKSKKALDAIAKIREEK